MTRFGQGHSKWVNLSLKHITATRHSEIPRGARGGGSEGERKKYSGSTGVRHRERKRERERERERDREREREKENYKTERKRTMRET